MLELSIYRFVKYQSFGGLCHLPSINIRKREIWVITLFMLTCIVLVFVSVVCYQQCTVLWYNIVKTGVIIEFNDIAEIQQHSSGEEGDAVLWPGPGILAGGGTGGVHSSHLRTTGCRHRAVVFQSSRRSLLCVLSLTSEVNIRPKVLFTFYYTWSLDPTICEFFSFSI